MNPVDRELHLVFGSGPVGMATAGALLKRNKTVKMVNRSGEIPQFLKDSGVGGLSCDLMDLTQVLKTAVGATHIYHCANPLYHQWGEILPTIQENLVEASIKNNAVLVVADNLYMYARGVEKITDDTLILPPTRKGKIRQNLAKSLEDACKTRGLKWVAIRASDYYGPWSGYQSVFGTDRFLDVLNQGKAPAFLGNPDQVHSYTYIGDFGEALVLAGLNPQAHGRAWICPNAPVTTTREIGDLFIKNWKGAVPKLKFGKIPRLALRFLGLFDPVIRELMEMLYQKEEPYVVEGTAFEKAFGFTPTPLEAGVKSTLAWFKIE